jgi:hypothetical protein
MFGRQTFPIPSDIDPSDLHGAEAATNRLAGSLDELLVVAERTRSGGSARAKSVLTTLWGLDKALAEAGSYYFTGKDMYEFARGLRWRVLAGFIDAAHDPSLAAESGWVRLWDEYLRVYDSIPVPWWGLATGRDELAIRKGELIGAGRLAVDVKLEVHPWHPRAWPVVSARITPSDRERLRVLVAHEGATIFQETIVPLDKTDIRILCVMEAHEGYALTQERIEGFSRVDRKTIRKRLSVLKEAGYVVSLKSPKRGSAITPAGKGRLRKIDLNQKIRSDVMLEQILNGTSKGKQLLLEIRPPIVSQKFPK